jgi:cytoskeletal protein RodZ
MEHIEDQETSTFAGESPDNESGRMDGTQEPMPDEKKSTKAEKARESREAPGITGVGELLREERRRRSLDRGDISAKTKLREHIVEAIEKEAWDKLPPPVFVRGFIRSYAQALGIDEAKALGLYNREHPVVPTDPAPLIGSEEAESGRGKRILLILLLGILGALLLYLWQGGPAPEWPSVSREDKASETVRVPPEDEAAETAADAEPASSPLDALAPIEPQTDAGEDAKPPALEEPVLKESEEVQSTDGPPYLLKAEVNERTWVKISVDGREPKEFLFQPGSRPEWKAEESFDIVIGNAGGIVLELNGELIDDLGASGQVIRLRLPSDV